MYGSFSRLEIDLLFVVAALGYFLFRRLLNNHPRPAGPSLDESEDSSLIMTMYTLGISLQKVSEGTLQGLHYSLLITSTIGMRMSSGDNEGGFGPELSHVAEPVAAVPAGTVRAPAGQIIMSMDLPAESQVHFAGFNTQDAVFRELLGNTSLDNTLTAVQLEGDFPDYFKLYCDRGREIELRQVLDPVSMAFLVDFCTHLNWELFENSLYFTRADSASKGGDHTTMIAAAEGFVQKILPTLQQMAATEPASASS